jgi:hypothetical protein
MSQLARYCYNDTGVPYGVLTNGARWVLFDPFLQGRPFAERIICDVDILNTDVDEARDELSLMAYASLAGLRAEIELRTTLSACWEAMWDEATELTRAVAKTLRARIGREIPALAAGLDVERVARFAGARLTSLGAGTNRGRLTTVPSRPGPPTRQHPQRGSKSPRPTESRRPGAIRKRPTRIVIGGNDRPASRAKHVLVETAEWLVGQGDIVPGSDPVTMGATRYIVSNTPRHRNDAHFASPHQLSNGLYLETNYTAAACETRARDLLERFGYAPSSEYLVVEWES